MPLILLNACQQSNQSQSFTSHESSRRQKSLWQFLRRKRFFQIVRKNSVLPQVFAEIRNSKILLPLFFEIQAQPRRLYSLSAQQDLRTQGPSKRNKVVGTISTYPSSNIKHIKHQLSCFLQYLEVACFAHNMSMTRRLASLSSSQYLAGSMGGGSRHAPSELATLAQLH